MNQNNSKSESTLFYFLDQDLFPLDFGTLSQIWPIIRNTPLRKRSKKEVSIADLPELNQLELALILIRLGHIHLRTHEDSEKFEIVLEVSQESFRIDPPQKDSSININ